MLQARQVVPMCSFGDSYIGRRRNNEDCLGKKEPADPVLRAERGCLYIVSDGMGGHAAGEIASRLAVETVLAEYYADAADPEASLVAAIKRANERIYTVAGEEPEKEGMGCTIVVCAVVGSRAIIAHVGDSRAYQVRNGELRLLTRDHLHVTEILGLTEEEAKLHHLRHVLSRALGTSQEVQVDMTVFPWELSDRFLLCSDGLSNAVPESEILSTLCEATPRGAVTTLLKLAEEHKADDNSSAIVVFLTPEDSQPLCDGYPIPELASALAPCTQEEPVGAISAAEINSEVVSQEIDSTETEPVHEAHLTVAEQTTVPGGSAPALTGDEKMAETPCSGIASRLRHWVRLLRLKGS